MTGTVIITKRGDSISVHPHNYTKNKLYWCFSVDVERYTYIAQPKIRYNAEITAKKLDYSGPPYTPKIVEELVIFRSNGGSLNVVDEAHTLLQSLLQAIDNGDPVWDVRDETNKLT